MIVLLKKNRTKIIKRTYHNRQPIIICTSTCTTVSYRLHNLSLGHPASGNEPIYSVINLSSSSSLGSSSSFSSSSNASDPASQLQLQLRQGRPYVCRGLLPSVACVGSDDGGDNGAVGEGCTSLERTPLLTSSNLKNNRKKKHNVCVICTRVHDIKPGTAQIACCC
jgi:hypothetical protein